MKKEFDASETMAKRMASASSNAIRALGSKIRDVGEDIGSDRAPIEILSKAAVGLHQAHTKFLEGVIVAYEESLKTHRRTSSAPPPPPPPLKLPGSEIFGATDTDTVAISGLASYEALSGLMNGSGYVPAEVQSGGKPCGLMHVYFNRIGQAQAGKTSYGGYEEILILASAWPARAPEEILRPVVLDDAKDKNPYKLLLPMLRGAANFAIKVFVDANNVRVVPFGRETLGLDKVDMKANFKLVNPQPNPKSRREPGPPSLDVAVEEEDGAKVAEKDRLTCKLKLDEPAARQAAEDVADALGIPMGAPQRSILAYDAVTRAATDEPFRKYSWVFKAKTPPRWNEVAADCFGDPKGKSSIRTLLTEHDFQPKVSTWTFGLDGGVGGIAFLPAVPSR